MKEGDNIWVNDSCGPMQAVFIRAWEDKNKAVIQFHGSPIVVELNRCFEDKRDCYTAAAAVEQKQAVVCLQRASAYSEIATKKE